MSERKTDSITFISDIPKKKAISDTWFKKLCSDKLVNGELNLKGKDIDEYSKLRRKALPEILNNKDYLNQIHVDVIRAYSIDVNKKKSPITNLPDDLSRLEYILNILTKKLTEKYGKDGSYLQTYGTMAWILYSYIGDKNKVIISITDGISITDKEIKTYLFLYKIIDDNKEKSGFVGTNKRSKYRDRIVNCITEALVETNKFSDKKDELEPLVQMQIAQGEEGPFALFSLIISMSTSNIISDEALYFLEKIMNKSIINNRFNNATLYYIYFILKNKLSPAPEKPFIMENLEADKNFFNAFYTVKNSLDEFSKKSIKRFDKICSGYFDSIKGNALCFCKEDDPPTRVGGRKKRIKRTKKRRKRCSKKRLKKKMICHRGTKKKLRKLSKLTKKLKLRLTRCSKKRLIKWKVKKTRKRMR